MTPNNPLNTPLRKGAMVFMRTVTMAYTGLVVDVTETEILLTQAAWIADSGRYHIAVSSGFPPEAEIEPYPDFAVVLINRAALVDCIEIKALPRNPQ